MKKKKKGKRGERKDAPNTRAGCRPSPDATSFLFAGVPLVPMCLCWINPRPTHKDQTEEKKNDPEMSSRIRTSNHWAEDDHTRRQKRRNKKKYATRQQETTKNALTREC